MMAAGASTDMISSLSNSAATLATLPHNIQLLVAQKKLMAQQLDLEKQSFDIWKENATPDLRFKRYVSMGFDPHSAQELAGAPVQRWTGGRLAPLSMNSYVPSTPRSSSFSAWRQVHDTFTLGTRTRFPVSGTSGSTTV